MKAALTILLLFPMFLYAQKPNTDDSDALLQASLKARGIVRELKSGPQRISRNPYDEYDRKSIPEGWSVILQDPYNESFRLKLAAKAEIKASNGGKIIRLTFDLPFNPVLEIRLSRTAEAKISETSIEISDPFGHASAIKAENGGKLLVEARRRRSAYLLDHRGDSRRPEGFDLVEISMSSSAGRRIHVAERVDNE